MKIVHFSESDSGGGAGTAAYRLHRAMVDQGMDSRMIVGVRGRNDATVIAGGGNRLTRLVASYANAKAASWSGTKWFFSSSFLHYGRTSHAAATEADAIVLHWVAGGFLSPRQLRSLRQPIYWRLSDIWPFSGGCHFPGTCTRYEGSCGACPALGAGRERDLSRWEWHSKHSAYANLNLTVVAPSRWIANCAQRSSLFQSRRIVHIPTGVDTMRFAPGSKEAARAYFSLPQGKNILLFGALRSTEDPRKGYHNLRRALQHLAARGRLSQVHLAIFGGPERPPAGEAGALPFPATWIGSIREEETLARLYAAADILIAPFIEDNLPNVVLEAAACGLPVAAFRTGGIPDIVEHQETGWLAPAGDDGSLAEGIEWLLADRVRRSVLGLAARNRVVNEFTLKRCANAWICLLKGTEEEHPAS